MDYYQDLSYYNRFHFENAQNVGFGKMTEEKKIQQLPAGFMPRLLKYLKYPLNAVRGGLPRRVTIEGETYTVGYAEIRVLGKDGRVFAAPNDIVACIHEAVYMPPAVFVDAVMNGVDPDSETYQAYLARYTPENCWGASNAYVMDVVAVVSKIAAGDLDGLKAMISGRKNLLELVTGNGSLLNEAIARQQEQIALYLIDTGIRLEKFEGEELLTAVESDMENVVAALMERNIPIKMDRPRNNPLFLAIGRHKNKIAEYLYNTRKDLVTTYNTEFTKDCNILQWTKMSNNTQFMEFMMKSY